MENLEETPQPPVAEVFEKVADLYPGISLYKVSISRTVEQAQNANVMDAATFELLTKTIAKDGALESLPFGYIIKDDPERPMFAVISGHHRKRSAAKAGVLEIYVLVTEKELTPDEIIQKQLAHNAISGSDDPQVLKELYERIKSVDARIMTGISQIDLDKAKFRPVVADGIKFDLSHKVVKFVFLSSQLEKLERVAESLEKTDNVVLADIELFDRFAATLRKLSSVEGIRNGAALVSKMLELAEAHIDRHITVTEGSSDTTGKKPSPSPKKVGFALRGKDMTPGME